MNYFSDCKTPDEAKDRYRFLAKENHPDKGGSSDTMKEINRQYDAWDFPRSQDQYYERNTYFYGMPGSGYKYGSPGGYNQKYYEQRSQQHLYNEIAQLKRDLEYARNANAQNHILHLKNEALIKELKKKLKASEKQRKEPTKPKKPRKMQKLKKESVIHL